VIEILSGIPGATLLDVTFVPYLREDVAQFATRLTGFLSGTLRSASTYLKAMMARYELFQQVQAQLFTQCDVVLDASVGDFDGIGHPLCSFPIGFGTDATTGLTVPRGAILGGSPFSEERILSVICAYQALTDWNTKRPADPTVAAPAPPVAARAQLCSAQEVTLASVPAWPGMAPDFVYSIDADSQPPDES
jgi:hypothetical protein